MYGFLSFRLFLTWLCVTFFISNTFLFAQTDSTAILQGVVKLEDGSAAMAQVWIPNLMIGGITQTDGKFEVNGIKPGLHTVIVKAIGYQTQQSQILFEAGSRQVVVWQLKPDWLALQQIVVSANRSQLSVQQAPVLVNTLSAQTIAQAQAVSLAEGLRFSPGLRVENNCQNCGFMQLRLNGLEGSYSQLLINSRPVISALAGVYALELLPTNMIERVEVVRGGGSVLFGGNAIAGTVNIITKDPDRNSFSIATNHAFTRFRTPDNNLSLRGSAVSENGKLGISYFGNLRNRAPFDANDDGFSELTKIKNATAGLDAFYAPNQWSKFKLGVFAAHEFRRGGSNFDLLPHQSAIAEQLKHRILGVSVQYELADSAKKNMFAVYSQMQWVNRDSYYGGGGRVLLPSDTLTEADLLALNAYGVANDLTAVSGLQFTKQLSKKLAMILGSEWRMNRVNDAMPGYNRQIDQTVNALGNYAQLTFEPHTRWQIVGGLRYEQVWVQGLYGLAVANFENNYQRGILVPRLAAMYRLKDDIRLRLSYAKGFRAPQAFDEDLHIESVGGGVRFIRINPSLNAETSNSFSGSVQWGTFWGNTQVNWVFDAFYTQLLNPFVLADVQVLANGVQVVEKINGDAATVTGLNAEVNFAFSRTFTLQSGFTVQNGYYQTPVVIWEPEAGDGTNPTSTNQLLRTPNVYGYASLQIKLQKRLQLAYSAIFTGSMWVPHMLDAESAFTTIKRTKAFFDNTVRFSYDLNKKGKHIWQIHAGMLNIWDSYQADFDRGASRDAAYVYGPINPRTVFFGVKYAFN